MILFKISNGLKEDTHGDLIVNRVKDRHIKQRKVHDLLRAIMILEEFVITEILVCSVSYHHSSD